MTLAQCEKGAGAMEGIRVAFGAGSSPVGSRQACGRDSQAVGVRKAGSLRDAQFWEELGRVLVQ